MNCIFMFEFKGIDETYLSLVPGLLMGISGAARFTV